MTATLKGYTFVALCGMIQITMFTVMNEYVTQCGSRTIGSWILDNSGARCILDIHSVCHLGHFMKCKNNEK